MRFFFSTAITLLSITFCPLSEAHSVQRNPLNYITRVDRPTLYTPSNRVHSHSSFSLSFFLHDVTDKIRIELEPNHNVLSDTASIQHIGPDGTIIREERIDRKDYKVYKGHAFLEHTHHSEWLNTGWARILVLRDGRDPIFEGTFKVNGNQHHIQRASTYRKTRIPGDPEIPEEDDEYMVVWRDTDVTPDPYGLSQELKREVDESASNCLSDQLDFNARLDHPVHMGWDIRDLESLDFADSQTIFRRQIDGTTGGNGAGVNLTSTIGSTSGCPTERKVALVGIATDCTYTAMFDTKSNVTQNVINVVNQASAVYESTFDISLGIQNLTISDSECPGTPSAGSPWNQECNDSVTIGDRLDLFSKWRGQFNDTNAYWTLLSTCNTGAAVGLAWLGQLCAQGSSPDGNDTTAGANVVVYTNTEWQVFAHETGHTFGAYHDCIDTTCADGTYTAQQCCPLSATVCNADGKFIMNPSTGSSITQFSACTVGNVCTAMGTGSVKSSCLTDNKDVVTITGSQCGNGIVEQGEQCDCGGDEGCANDPCCDVKTCKYTSGSVCDPMNEGCCTSQCQFMLSGTTCRNSTGSCDPAETCTGSSGECPADEKAPDGQNCGASGSGLKCASGQCTSRTLQCQALVGSLSNNNETTACDEDSCTVRCTTAQNPDTCYDYQQNFLDGTTCTIGGKCSNGVCKGASTTDKITAFFRDNKNVVIPVASAVGGLIVIALLSCCITCWRRRRARKRAVARAVVNAANGSTGAPIIRRAKPRAQRKKGSGFGFGFGKKASKGEKEGDSGMVSDGSQSDGLQRPWQPPPPTMQAPAAAARFSSVRYA
ncbi:zinc metalloprotease mde10 [Xylariaceae sp. FL0255]|nr:zinc metalloprotease mde10 [Xylariaceae sp. FL0255]